MGGTGEGRPLREVSSSTTSGLAYIGWHLVGGQAIRLAPVSHLPFGWHLFRGGSSRMPEEPASHFTRCQLPGAPRLAPDLAGESSRQRTRGWHLEEVVPCPEALLPSTGSHRGGSPGFLGTTKAL